MSQPKLERDLDIIQKSDLQITLLDGDLNIIQKLDDEPNDVGGLTAAELKAEFDKAGNIIKTYLNESLVPELLAADAVEAKRAADEAERAAAEAERVSAETERRSGEERRSTAEAGRISAETQRTAAEEGRTSAELARAAAEAQRIPAETAREAAETARAGAEVLRQEAEAVRGPAETARIAAEEARQAAETARIAAETARIAAEEARLVWEAYDPARVYIPGNKVYFLGSSYVNTRTCTDVLPSDASCWQMIASRGADGADALSQNAADLRYLQLAGGIMTGPLTVREPTAEGHAAPRSYVDAAAQALRTAAEDGVQAAKAYADGLKKAVDSAVFTRTQTLKAATASLYGKTAAAVPDDIFAAIRPLITAAQSSADAAKSSAGAAASSANLRARIAYGSYAGTEPGGTMYKSHSFDFEPYLLVVCSSGTYNSASRTQFLLAVRGASSAAFLATTNGNVNDRVSGNSCEVSFSGKSIKTSYMNMIGNTYVYAAIG